MIWGLEQLGSLLEKRMIYLIARLEVGAACGKQRWRIERQSFVWFAVCLALAVLGRVT